MAGKNICRTPSDFIIGKIIPDARCNFRRKKTLLRVARWKMLKTWCCNDLENCYEMKKLLTESNLAPNKTFCGEGYGISNRPTP